MAKKENKSTLSDFFDESVPSAMKRTIADNTPFRIVENGKTFYVCMLLDAAKIGGINKKSSNNAQIGGMIECVKGQKIDLYVTAETLEKGELLFVPTPVTFDGLSDYGLFTNCNDYEFVKLNTNLEIVERTGIYASYAKFREISSGQASITDYIKPPEPEPAPDKKMSDSTDSSENPAGHGLVSQVVDKAKSVASAVADKASAIAQTVAEKVADSTGYKDMVPESAKKAENTSADAARGSQSHSNADTTASAQSAEASDTVEEDVVYTETQIQTAVTRMFHADNLDLPVSSEPFDQLFTLNNQLIRFDTDSRDTYVNERLNAMAADANRDLQKLRTDNLRKLREKYFMLMSVRVLEIQKELDINNQDTEYGSQKWALENTRKDKFDKVASLVEEKRKLLEADFNRRRDEYCEASAKNARIEFNAKFQRAHNEDLNKIDNAVKNEIQADYERDLQNLYTARRNEALTLLDLNITGVLKELTKDYKTMFDEENALYMKRADEMREYAKELHSEDAKRIAVEEERNRISNEVNDARAEAAAKIDLIKREYETAQTALEARSKATIEQAETQCQMLKEQMDSRADEYEKEKARLQQQIDDAMDRAAQMQETIKADYEHRLEQANDDRDSWKQTFESYKEQHKHNSRLAAILVVAITIAAIAGGFVAGGVYWNRAVAGEHTSDQVSPQFINVIEPEKNDGAITPDETTSMVITEETEGDDVSTGRYGSAVIEETAESSLPDDARRFISSPDVSG